MAHDDAKLAVYLAHRAALIDYATPIVGGRSQAEDVVQEAYFRFVPQAPADPKIDQPVAYLYRIVRNLALDWTRRTSAEARRDQAQIVAAGAAPLAPSPEEEALHRSELRIVAAALAELPDRVRLAFELHRFGGCTFQQIAEQLGVSLATANRLAQEALLHVARRLQRPED